ncbi:hypothetical protein RchiOBHm_Chr1g0319321 [Rosa chinensis]|uniref:Uncharacterized protein n=1 Tax=Rosa chinensis TaxID=74649 RepID=A0A2P6S8C9_ROSCH|nr:hypothetical protein RchiOBHm_Chr1g0319321 [Rosa chinensis]
MFFSGGSEKNVYMGNHPSFLNSEVYVSCCACRRVEKGILLLVTLCFSIGLLLYEMHR